MDTTSVPEQWVTVAGFESYYEVSDLGRVRSVRAGRCLKACVGASGYEQVDLSLHGRARSFTVHQLVATAFLGPAKPGMQVCHCDGNRRNNCALNLRYGTPVENNADKARHGTTVRGVANNKAKLSAEDVIEVRQLAAAGLTHRSIAQRFGVSRPAISYVVRRETWAHIGEQP